MNYPMVLYKIRERLIKNDTCKKHTEQYRSSHFMAIIWILINFMRLYIRLWGMRMNMLTTMQPV